MNVSSMPQCHSGASKNIKEQSQGPSSYCMDSLFITHKKIDEMHL